MADIKLNQPPERHTTVASLQARDGLADLEKCKLVWTSALRSRTPQPRRRFRRDHRVPELTNSLFSSSFGHLRHVNSELSAYHGKIADPIRRRLFAIEGVVDLVRHSRCRGRVIPRMEILSLSSRKTPP